MYIPRKNRKQYLVFVKVFGKKTQIFFVVDPRNESSNIKELYKKGYLSCFVTY